MNDRAGKSGDKAQVEDRDARLKAALKANLARRKAQAKARAAADGDDKKNEGQ